MPICCMKPSATTNSTDAARGAWCTARRWSRRYIERARSTRRRQADEHGGDEEHDRRNRELGGRRSVNRSRCGLGSESRALSSPVPRAQAEHASDETQLSNEGVAIRGRPQIRKNVKMPPRRDDAEEHYDAAHGEREWRKPIHHVGGDCAATLATRSCRKRAENPAVTSTNSVPIQRPAAST